MKTSQLGIDLVKFYEGTHDGNLSKIGLQPKTCPSGIWTIGYGRALKDIDGKWLKGVDGFSRLMDIYPDWETITLDEAEDMLEEDLERFEAQVDSLNLKLKQYQYDAVVSICYNIGFGNFLSSTLLRRIKGEKGSIREAFAMWNKSNGVTLKGLQRRRESEATLFLDGALKF